MQIFYNRYYLTIFWCTQKKYVIRWCTAYLVSTNPRLCSTQLKGSKSWKHVKHVKTKEENAKFLRLLSTALPSDYTLLHPSYCPDLNTKMKNEDFFNFLSPCTNSHKEQRNYDVCNYWVLICNFKIMIMKCIDNPILSSA